MKCFEASILRNAGPDFRNGIYREKAREQAARFGTCCKGDSAAVMLNLMESMRVKAVTDLIEEGIAVGMGYMRVVYQNTHSGVHYPQGDS